MDAETKTLENRLRRTLERRGYRLEKSRRRDPLALDYGKYWVWNMNNSIVSVRDGKPVFSATGPESGITLTQRLGCAGEGAFTLEEIARWVDSMGEREGEQ